MSEQSFENSGSEPQQFNNVAAAVAELDRRDAERKASEKAKRQAKEPAPEPDEVSDNDDSDDDADPRKVQKPEPEDDDKPKKKAKKEPEPEPDEDEDEGDDEAEESDDDEDVTPDDDEDSEPKDKKRKPSLDNDSVEVEYEGKTHRVPKELKDAVLRQADYTRKTTEVAQERQVLHQTYAQAQQSIQQLSTAQQTLMQYAQAFIGEEPPLELAQHDPGEYLRQRTMHEHRQRVFQQISQQGETARQEQARLAHMQEAENRRINEQQMLARAPELKDPAKREALAKNAAKYLEPFGFSLNDVAAINDARTVLLLRRVVELETQAQRRSKVEGELTQKLSNVPSKTIKPGASSESKDRSAQEAKRRFMKSARSMKDVEAFLKASR
jgi:hypothetical protein